MKPNKAFSQEVESGKREDERSSPEISVIVPMYKTELFLEKCIESLRSQTFRDVEILLINDGSPDHCRDIGERYCRTDPRIRIVDRENGGLGPARNTGLDRAQGRYVGFVDSDDWVDEDMLERMFQAVVKYEADICFSGLRLVSNGNTLLEKRHSEEEKVLETKEDIFNFRKSFYGASPSRAKEEAAPMSVCCAIYKRSLIDDEGIRFPNIQSEDMLFNTDVCCAAKKIVVLPDIFYNYRKDGQASLTNGFTKETIAAFLNLFDALSIRVKKEEAERRGECQTRVSRQILDGTRGLVKLIASSSEPKDRKLAIVKELSSNSRVAGALRRYPWWKLPLAQQAFFWSLKTQSPRTMLFLADLRSHFGK